MGCVDITNEELKDWKKVVAKPSDAALMQIAFNLAHIYDMLRAIKEDTMCYGDYFSAMCEGIDEMNGYVVPRHKEAE